MSASNVPEKLGFVLRRRLRRLGLAPQAEAAWICAVANRTSNDRYVAVRYRDGTLTLKAPNSLAAHELRLEADQLTAALREQLNWPPDKPLRLRVVL